MTKMSEPTSVHSLVAGASPLRPTKTKNSNVPKLNIQMEISRCTLSPADHAPSQELSVLTFMGYSATTAIPQERCKSGCVVDHVLDLG